MVAAALWATVRLIDDLIHGSAVTNDPARLLAAGALVRLGNNLSFSLLYWLIDSGGPSMRAQQSVPADFAFTQHMSPELGPHGWRPVFLDYLHLGFTNATAFSPTDVMPLTHRAKYTMLVQSTIARVIRPHRVPSLKRLYLTARSVGVDCGDAEIRRLHRGGSTSSVASRCCGSFDSSVC
jgi:hypothetical protein